MRAQRITISSCPSNNLHALMRVSVSQVVVQSELREILY